MSYDYLLLHNFKEHTQKNEWRIKLRYHCAVLFSCLHNILYVVLIRLLIGSEANSWQSEYCISNITLLCDWLLLQTSRKLYLGLERVWMPPTWKRVMMSISNAVSEPIRSHTRFHGGSTWVYLRKYFSRKSRKVSPIESFSNFRINLWCPTRKRELSSAIKAWFCKGSRRIWLVGTLAWLTTSRVMALATQSI